MSEADIHFALYHHLQNAIEEEPVRGTIRYGAVRPEYGDGISGRADLVVFDASDNPLLVIEAKKPGEDGNRDIDPYSPDVMEQALEYGAKIGSPYCATFNASRLLLFRTLEPGKPFLERATSSYDISSVETFAGKLLEEVARFHQQDASWDSLDDAFVSRVRSLHEYVTPRLEGGLAVHLESDEAFRESFGEWTAKQGIELDSAGEDERREVVQEFAEQAAYLLINKILFYKLLENSPAYEDEVPPLAVSIHRVQEDLKDHFDAMVENVDFEAIFEHDPIFSEIPLEPVSEKVRDFILELDDQDLTQFDSDVIGRIYEGVIPHERRHEMGEYYTPPAVCDLITRLTITETSDDVLDPACGSGGFLVSSYHRLQSLLNESAGSHPQILNQIHGIDINRFPAHLSAINLAVQDLNSYTDEVNIEINDFFETSPDSLRFGRETANAEGSSTEEGLVDEIGGFDAVVGNPPYIRSRNMNNKDRIRRHLSSFDTDISRRMDIYGYFITHATQFLSDGGRLGFIISDRWLDTGYGADLQQFLLNNYEINAVIRFDRQTFEDALVGSSVLIATRQPEASERNDNTINFLRVREPLEIDEVVSILQQDVEADQMVNDPEYRLVTRRQGDLYEKTKWNVYFMASPIYFDLTASDDTSQLEDLAEVTWGIKTGANAFFYNRQEDWEDLGLTEYTTPLLKASGQLDRIRFTDEDAKEWSVLDLHDKTQQALEDVMEHEEADNDYKHISQAEKVKDWLLENGHDRLVEYIEQGEDKGYHERATTSSRDIWFNLDDLPIAPILTTDFTWRICRSVWNEAGAAADGQFYLIEPDDDIDDKVVCGILNSRLAWLMVELRGRWAGGQGMTRARIKVYETEEMPVPDPRSMTDAEKASIRDAFEALMEKEDALDEGERTVENTVEERRTLDKAALAPLGMSDRVDELRNAVEELVALREQDAGERTQVLVNRPKETEVIELEGVSKIRESTTLDDF